MKNIKNINGILVKLIFFISYIGYYLVLMLLIKFGFYEHSRAFTIPLRIILLLSLVALLIINFKKANFNRLTYVFLGFTIIYLINLGIHFFNNDSYFLPVEEVLLLYISSAFIPFVAISTFSLKETHIKSIFSVLLISGFLFSIFIILFYGNFLGQVERLSTGRIHERTISPLTLSYTSTLVVGMTIAYLLYNKINNRNRVFLIITIVLAFIPFFLGVSRGSVIALFLPFVIMIAVRRKRKPIFYGTLILILSLLVLVYIDFLTGSNFVNRLSDIRENIKNNDNSVARVFIWKSSFLQFIEDPIFGGKLSLKNWTVYPHNIILETLQFTGIVGFIPFIILLIKGIQISIGIFINNIKYSWLAILFLQSLIQSLFSGAIFNASWYWFSLSLLIAFSFFIKKNDSMMDNKASLINHFCE